uniref:Uncharacterized protein n=1 Tax=Haptolina ericina TaxID=156174 RepID=A0A7S3AUQ4_9EUKA|mmetsp:Transcript_36823/g.83336  ORF Transcript_36823/g.83336 Transcript_36823/m.83336 type:complete len:161 (+) Transcript_36823:877-1359(+)
MRYCDDNKLEECAAYILQASNVYLQDEAAFKRDYDDFMAAPNKLMEELKSFTIFCSYAWDRNDLINRGEKQVQVNLTKELNQIYKIFETDYGLHGMLHELLTHTVYKRCDMDELPNGDVALDENEYSAKQMYNTITYFKRKANNHIYEVEEAFKKTRKLE